LAKSSEEAFETLREITDTALARGYSVVGLSASSSKETDLLKDRYELEFPFYFTDMTTLKTIVRSNPGVLRLHKGTIVQKVHYNDLSELRIQEVPEEERYLEPLKKSLDSVLLLDQKYRSGNMTPELLGKQWLLDQQNIIFIDSVISRYGYPGKSLVGEPTNLTAWYVVQHSDRIDDFLPQIKVAADTGELPFRLYAMMLDRSLMQKGMPQRYGTQAMTYFWGTPEEVNLIWPVEDPDRVNALREAAGYEQTIEEYALDMLGGMPYREYTMEEVREFQERQKQKNSEL
jgi:hypothetical protein